MFDKLSVSIISNIFSFIPFRQRQKLEITCLSFLSASISVTTFEEVELHYRKVYSPRHRNNKRYSTIAAKYRLSCINLERYFFNSKSSKEDNLKCLLNTYILNAIKFTRIIVNFSEEISQIYFLMLNLIEKTTQLKENINQFYHVSLIPPETEEGTNKFIDIMRKCLLLTKVDITITSREQLKYLAKICIFLADNIESFTLKFTTYALRDDYDHQWCQIKFQKVKELNINFLANTETICNISRNFPQLQTLRIGVYSLNDLVQFPNVKKMEVLYLKTSAHDDSHYLQLLAPKIKSISLAATNSGFPYIWDITNLRKFKTKVSVWCNFIALPEWLSKVPGLEECESCDWNPFFIEWMIENVPLLKTFNISSNYPHDSFEEFVEALRLLVERIKTKRQITFKIDNKFFITEESMVTIGPQCILLLNNTKSIFDDSESDTEDDSDFSGSEPDGDDLL